MRKGQPGEDAGPPPTQSEKEGGISSIPTPPHSGGRRQGTYKAPACARFVPSRNHVNRSSPDISLQYSMRNSLEIAPSWKAYVWHFRAGYFAEVCRVQFSGTLA